MKIIRKKNIKLDKPVPVYDIIQATPFNNFVLGNGVVSHNCALMDEMEFMKGQSDNMIQSKVFSFYNTIKRRMESRFLNDGGSLPTTLFLVSSKQEQNNFLEQYTQTIKNKPTTYVVDKPIWEIKPSKTYSGKTFRVAIGNKQIPSSIVKDESLTFDQLMQEGYDDVIHVPIEYYSAFELDMKSALRDIAGRSTTDMVKFISSFALRRCYARSFASPFSQEVITVSLDDANNVQDYFNVHSVPEDIKRLPGFIHVDAGLKNDKTGISYVVPVDTVISNSYVNDATKNFIQAGEEVVTMQVFSVGIQANKGSEVSLKKIREFFQFLREEGFNIDTITYDGFQSADSIQLLTIDGFNAKLLSLDRNNNGYDSLRSSINDSRIILGDLKDSLLETELINLEKTPAGKIDHPITGSKDIADSLAGANYNAITSDNVRGFAYTKYILDDDSIEEDLLDVSAMLGLGDYKIVDQYDSFADLLDDLDDFDY